MSSNKPYILQVTAGVTHGGASKMAVNLYEALKQRNFNSKIATGGPVLFNEDFLQIPKKTFSHDKNMWESFFFSLCRKTAPLIGKIKGTGQITNILYNLGKPSCLIKNLRGIENFANYPGTWSFFDSLDPFPNIVHCHNLHGKYFDLSILPYLSRKVPVVVTLHDEWMFTGHCAYSLDCDLWKTGCGKCPDLKRYSAIWRDTTAYNSKQKHDIYKRSKLHIATPSQWLLDRAKQSILAPAINSSHVINNGINLEIFTPGDKANARKKLSLPHDVHVVLFIASNAKKSVYKDYPTLEKAIHTIASEKKLEKKVLVLVIGEMSENIYLNNVTIEFKPYIQNELLPSYLHAADLFVHATNSDNYPTTVLEALACGTPVVGANVGGVPEQIVEDKTGLLYRKGDYLDLANKITLLLSNPETRDRMSYVAAKYAKEHFGIEKQMKKQVSLYENLLSS